MNHKTPDRSGEIRQPDRTMLKTAVWIYLLGDWTISGLGVNPNLTGADKAAAQRVLTATKAIYQRGMYWDEFVSPKMTATPDQSTAYLTTINGEECYQQVFTIDSNTWALTPVLLSLDEGAPAGTKIMSMDNDEISQIKLATTRTPGAGYQAQVKVVYQEDRQRDRQARRRRAFSHHLRQQPNLHGRGERPRRVLQRRGRPHPPR